VFTLSLVFFNRLAADESANPNANLKAFSSFPPAPLKLAREKNAPHLWLPEQPLPNELPFWRAKESIQKKMREERMIPVSVNKKNLEDAVISYEIKGAGIVHAGGKKAFETSQKYQKLSEVSSHFKSVFYDEKNQQLFLVIEALGYETKMILAMDTIEEKKRREIQFEVVWGELKGMRGAIGFENLDDEHSEVSILSHYQAKKFPLPKIFMGFAFEILTQKIAEKMRHFIETHRDESEPDKH